MYVRVTQRQIINQSVQNVPPIVALFNLARDKKATRQKVLLVKSPAEGSRDG